VPGGPSIRELLKRPVPLPEDLGRLPADLVALEDTHVLAHLAAAGARGRAMDVLQPPPGTYTRAPNPSKFREAKRREHAAVTPRERELRVLTYNVALLHRTYLGQTVESPHRAGRRGPLIEVVFSGAWDLILLQEVWNDADASEFRAAAEAAGYVVFTGARRYEHGLFLAARAPLVRREERSEHIYATQYHLEGAPGPSIRRGFLRWTIEGDAGRITVFDTHTSAFPWAASRRAMQARELGLAAASRPEDELVIVGGDLNAAWSYPSDEGPDGWTGWWANAASIPLLLHYGGLEDAWVLARGADEEPTATDANELYRSQYGGTEHPARIDHVMVRPGRAQVADAAVLFDQRRGDLGAPAPIELSDHYGLGVCLTV